MSDRECSASVLTFLDLVNTHYQTTTNLDVELEGNSTDEESV